MMDFIKSIPQAFFDMFARITPGIIFMFCFLLISPILSWEELLGLISANTIATENSFGFAVLSLIGLGFILGHLIAPLGKLLAKPKLLNKEIEAWEKYDWLRINCSVASILTVRIRSEYTMHFSNSAAFFISSIVCLLSPWLWNKPIMWWSFIIFFSLFLSSLYRGAEVKKIFWKSVSNLYKIANKNIVESGQSE